MLLDAEPCPNQCIGSFPSTFDGDQSPQLGALPEPIRCKTSVSASLSPSVVVFVSDAFDRPVHLPGCLHNPKRSPSQGHGALRRAHWRVKRGLNLRRS
ncbi:hypothetical protein, partial [Mesorhizobium sp.]|uniref:hypothetical protein n=1 Tax=Mesorhizobium sp. TaxID=1871066 RepID=UPI0025EEFC09